VRRPAAVQPGTVNRTILQMSQHFKPGSDPDRESPQPVW
jgi:hypothetical protein